MVWGKKNLILLLIILDGVSCDGIFDVHCSNASCQCGEAATITCILTHPVKEISLHDSNKTLLSSSMATKGKMSTDDHKISIEWTEDKVEVVISEFKFSDKLKYRLTLFANESGQPHEEPINIKVSGSCKPEISKNSETKELECEAENEYKASIVWIDNHRKDFPATRTKEPEELTTGFKLWSSLKWTEESVDHHICCYVSYRLYGVYKENKSCVQNTSAMSAPSSTWSPALSGIIILLAVVVVASVPLSYLLKRSRRG